MPTKYYLQPHGMFCLVGSFPSHVLQIWRLIRNFLWSGKAKGHDRSKVKWEVITLLLSKGGLGVIDLVDQRRVLLGKLIFRGFTPSHELCKVLLLNRCSECFPCLGASWSKDVSWIFRENFKMPSSHGWEDRFI